MPLNARLDLLPPDAVTVGDSLAIHRDGDRIVFFNAAGPIFTCHRDDRVSIRVAAVTVLENGWAKKTDLAKALGLHRSTLHRDLRKFRESGVEGLAEKRRGPKQAHTLTPEVIQEAQKLLDSGERSQLQVKKNDEVLFTSYAGTEVKVGGDEYIIMDESDILAVLDS